MPANPILPTKICSSCGDELPREEFYGNGKKTSECPRCISEKNKDKYHADPSFRREKIEKASQWREANIKHDRTWKRQWYSGWTQERFDAAWEAQGGLCAICSIPMIKYGTFTNSVCTDHDHETGCLRDLLCGKCNKLLGIYEKNRVAFEAYVHKHRKNG